MPIRTNSTPWAVTSELATAHANRFTRGYFDQSAQVWSRDGVLPATTHQIVYFKS